MKYGNHSSWKRFTSSPITLLVLFVLLLILAKTTSNIHEKADLSAAKLETAQLELDKLEKHRQELARQVDYLSTEQGIEAELRTKYRAVREGESVAVIVGEETITPEATTTVPINSEEISWWGKVLRTFGL